DSRLARIKAVAAEEHTDNRPSAGPEGNRASRRKHLQEATAAGSEGSITSEESLEEDDIYNIAPHRGPSWEAGPPITTTTTTSPSPSPKPEETTTTTTKGPKPKTTTTTATTIEETEPKETGKPKETGVTEPDASPSSAMDALEQYLSAPRCAA
ncbi:unnamed protein product, partial [Polarella glacialis]